MHMSGLIANACVQQWAQGGVASGRHSSRHTNRAPWQGTNGHGGVFPLSAIA